MSTCECGRPSCPGYSSHWCCVQCRRYHGRQHTTWCDKRQAEAQEKLHQHHVVSGRRYDDCSHCQAVGPCTFCGEKHADPRFICAGEVGAAARAISTGGAIYDADKELRAAVRLLVDRAQAKGEPLAPSPFRERG